MGCGTETIGGEASSLSAAEEDALLEGSGGKWKRGMVMSSPVSAGWLGNSQQVAISHCVSPEGAHDHTILPKPTRGRGNDLLRVSRTLCAKGLR